MHYQCRATICEVKLMLITFARRALFFFPFHYGTCYIYIYIFVNGVGKRCLAAVAQELQH